MERREVVVMLEAINISKNFGSQQVLRTVSLNVDKGSIVTLFGPTGSGKSTLLEILAGIQSPTDGEVRIDGIKAYRPQHRFLPPFSNGLFHNKPRHDIAMVFQDYAVFPWMTVLNNVTFTLSICGVPREQRKVKALEYLQKVGLASSLGKYPSQLSGGMKQRLALARALAVAPRLILMDEPFASVDQITREQLQDLLLDIWAATKVTIVLVTHDISEAAYLSDKIVLFNEQGAIQQSIEVNISRQRKRTSPELVSVQAKISALIKNT